MINGIDVLLTERVVTKTCPNTKLCLIVAGIVISVFVIICIVSSCIDFDAKRLGLLCKLGVLSALACSLITGFITNKPVEYETHYTVTISDEVNFHEFIQNYEIIKQEDKLFTIRKITNGERK